MRKTLIDKDYADIDMAAYEIGRFCTRWGRIFVSQTKEKFGTARVYCHFGCPNLHNLIWPNYHYTQWESLKFLGTMFRFFDRYIVEYFIYYSRINYVVVPYQQFIYRLAYKRAFKKYSHLKANIKHGADYTELLTGLCSKN